METPISAAPTLAGDFTPPAGQPLSDATDSSQDTIRDPESGHGPREQQQQAAQPAEKAVHDDDGGGGNTNNIVDWDGPDDPERPRNWPARRKVPFVVVTCGMITCVSFGSSVFAPAEHVFAAAFGVPLVVGQLGVSLWILGFFAGPIFFGPTSEVFGHLLPLAVAMVGMAVFQVPVALGGSVATVLVCRFFAGAFGSGAFAVVSGTYFELYEPIPRGVALAASGMSINLGATVAPVAGAFLSYEANWRWTAWVTLIFAGVLCLAALFTVRETSSRKILQLKARRLRFETGNWALHAKSEETPIRLHDIVQRYLTKPVRIIVQEPILVILTAYLTLVYGILYLSFQAFPAAYQQRGWSVPVSDLPFLAVLLGVVSAFLTCSLYTLTYYKRRVVANHGMTEPEWRLPPMILGAGILPPSLFWFGWSGNVHWICQVIASYMIGYGLLLIFITGIVYLVDVYQHHANSAMSIHVIVRSLIACSFPLWANIMYDHLGIPWGTSLLAFLCILMLCAPVTFYFYGARIRSWSRFSVRSAI
ncbi:hypothetical protein Daus18300_013566 [Diaporthe australafricana]|uniref:Major facilitator superfamily (MFS) profile domain-containing protein n=1 Tax=Diaporthe australafricana TaxID=127596 RepID=A0ABR3VYL6_9PEZI